MGTLDAAVIMKGKSMPNIDENDISRRIRRVFVKALSLNLDPVDGFMPDTDLSLIAGLDSLAILEFIAGLEEEFNIQIDIERLNIEFLSDLKALTAYLAECLNAGPQY